MTAIRLKNGKAVGTYRSGIQFVTDQYKSQETCD